ncbi:FAD dependent oxidoreductase [Mycena albidolilacea]|uniref:FAD dependent oxidoreductase n=1 Tax=Mycena albidolilacea TaxID=1033008 RepID=A0AAD6ZK62_9AGAR|nr:FAD dependent oxidoreductase [Mycena albidolilacea]
MSSDSIRNIVLVGGGIIGCSTAYYLTRHPSFVSSRVAITLIEASAHGAAQGASGKAGGLVAKWAYPKELVNVSFNEHVKLANEHGGTDRWGWRFVSTGSWEGRGELLPDELSKPPSGLPREKSLEKTLGLPEGRKTSSNRDLKGLPDDLLWVKENLTQSYSPMAPEGATAQVHPYLFTTSMLDLAKEKGVQFISGTVTSIIQSGGKVTGVKYCETSQGTSKTLAATDVIVCGGAWSPTLIPGLPVESTRAHSVVIRTAPAATIAPYVLFTEITGTGNGVVSPEIYARPDGTVYACGPGDDSPLPANIDDVPVDLTACENLLKNVSAISDELRAGAVEVRQACFLPVSSIGGGPIIGEVENIAKGLFVATGHTCWGISNAPGTAKAMAELVMEGKIKCANLKKLHPSKFL